MTLAPSNGPPPPTYRERLRREGLALAASGALGAQAVAIERTVAAGERRTNGRYVRLAGSRIVRGTRLGRLA